jgi:outer membrane protein assembly factor BamA
MKLVKHIAVVFFICSITLCVHAQKACRLVITQVDTANLAPLNIKTVFPSRPACDQYVQQLPGILMAAGYISASIDSIYRDSAAVYLQLFLGGKYIWDDIRVDDKDWYVLNLLGFNKAGFHNKPFDGEKVSAVYNLLLDYFANNGYPFAKVGLDSVELNGGKINAHLNIDKGLTYHIDSLVINGNIRLSRKFLYHYLDLKPHDVYQQNKLDKISRRLAELPYLEQVQPWNINMLNTGADVNLYLQPRRSNQVNVLVGFLPANQQIGGKLLLTGDATLDLRNPFGNGETIGVTWQQLQSKSPRLNLVFQRPYIFNSPFGLNFNFELYKKDSTYININAQGGVQYVLSASQSGMVYIQTQSTKVLDVDTAFVKATRQLPPIIDVSSVSLALQYNFNNTNYRFNPRSGNDLQFVTSFGNKRIKKSDAILQIKDPSFNYAQLYDSLKTNSYQFKVRASFAHYTPLGKQSALKAAANAGWYQSPNYFQNELFQIGGYKLLRGFDEESIYANRFAVGTLEYHYLLGQNSYLFAFGDYGWAKYQTELLNYAHTYLGLGFGLAFETKTGVFNISFAEGKRNDLSFDFRQSKIHLGFVSVF